QFSLLAGLFHYLFSKTDVNILIVGLDYAGKTTLLEQMKGIFKKVQGIPPHKIPPTVGLNVGKMDIQSCSVTFWDLGGQSRVRSLWERYYEDAHGLIFVIDAADASRFEEAQLAFDAVREQAELHGMPTMLFANKQDLPDAVPGAEVAAMFDTHKITSVPFRMQPVSGLTCEGIAEGVGWIVGEAKKRTRRITSLT
ncbi:unnamed protein product, partial [Phaeothamnion confervicola]